MSKVKIPKQSKGGRVVFREIVLRDEIIDDIKAFYMGQKSEDYMFTALRTNDMSLKKKPISITAFNKLLKQEMKAKGVETEGNVSSHMIRKTYGAALYRSFIDEMGYSELEALFACKEVFNHRSIETTRIYVGLKRRVDLEAISKINFYNVRQTA